MAVWWKFIKTKVTNEEKTNTTNVFNENDLEIAEFNPKNYEEVEIVANTLTLKKPVRLNLQNTVHSDRRRILDFLCGVAYVLNFTVQKVDLDFYEFKKY